MDKGFSRDLDAWLNSTSDSYVVTQTLKESPHETTQVVYRKNELGEPAFGPFVRKIFSANAEVGSAYQTLYAAQAQGMRLEHVPMVYECSSTQNHREVVMEFVHGQTLLALAEQEGVGTRLAERVIPGLCDAVSQLHESFATPLVHRDIKPSNVMVDGERVCVIDLGIARAYRTDATHDTVRYGTPGYAPPEQFGYGQTSVRSDLYALGMTAAYCFCGQDPTPELRERGFGDPRIPAAVRPVLMRATEFDPSRRYASAREFKQAFVEAMAIGNGQMPQAAPAGPAHNEGFTPSVVVGLVWDAIVCAAFTLWTIAILAGATRANGPIFINYVAGIFGILIPSAAFAWLILDKRQFRAQLGKLGRLSRGKEALLCIAVGVVSFLLCAIVLLTWSAFTGQR